MNILIYTKNIIDAVEKIKILTPLLDNSRIRKQEALLACPNCTIKIKRFNESQRGNKSRIILYDGDYTTEDIDMMAFQLIDNRPIFNDKGKVVGNKNETLIAPISILKWLMSSNNITYINKVGKFDNEEIKLVTKDLVKAINFFRENNGTIYCYRDDIKDGELWFKDCCEAFKCREDFDSYESLIEFIAIQE